MRVKGYSERTKKVEKGRLLKFQHSESRGPYAIVELDDGEIDLLSLLGMQVLEEPLGERPLV